VHDLNLAPIAVFSVCVIVWALVSARLQRWDVSAPIAFVVLGVVVTHGPTAIIHLNLHSSTIRTLAEFTLALVLFSDASRVNARALRADMGLPTRLLGVGLPLTIGAGAALAVGLFPGAGLWVAAAIAAMVAPTDAALGASIMSDERVPAGVRRVLNVESGLNDGIATPFVNLFLAGAATAEAAHTTTSPVGALLDLLGGAGIGLGIGVIGAVLFGLARKHHWSSPAYRPLSVLALALFSYSAAVLAGANGFVAAFVGGIAFGTALPDRNNGERDGLTEFSEQAGSLMSLIVWFIFGAVMLVPGLQGADWRDLVFALLALTAIRMISVAIALTGSGLDRATVSFVGWFGPRGLASVVFGLLAVDLLAPADAGIVLPAVTVTIALSVLLHGVTAGPLAARYGTYAVTRRPDSPEHHVSASLIHTRRLQSVCSPFASRSARQ
jgi:NhaP-type Na+/H+ or K+/H+ antiporter